MSRIFILEDDPERIIWFHERFKGHEVKFIHTTSRADEFQGPYDLVLLDHDLGGRQMTPNVEDDGAAVAALIRHGIDSNTTVIVHSHNPGGCKRIETALRGKAVISLPFRSREFTEILDRLIPPGVTKEKE